jgi:hypothetical protein
MTTTDTAIAPDAHRAREAISRVALVAVLAVGLGLFMQALVVVLRLADGIVLAEARTLAELMGSITWSVIVCTGVAIGMSIGKARALLGAGLAFFFAPLALASAKAVEKVMLAVMEASQTPAILSLELVGVVRAAEYGLLALMLTMLTERRAVRFAPYALAGLTIGVVFGGLVTALTLVAGAPSGPVAIATLVAKEVGSPLGCALVIFVGQMISRSFRLYSRANRRTAAAAESNTMSAL